MLATADTVNMSMPCTVWKGNESPLSNLRHLTKLSNLGEQLSRLSPDKGKT